MANKEIKITVRVRNLVSKGLESARRSLQSFRAGVSSVMKGLGVVAKGATVAFGALGYAVSRAFKKEGYLAQLSFFTGNIKNARARWADLVKIINGSQFGVDEIFRVSKGLEVAGLNGEKNVQWVRMIGDAAARVDPSKLEEIAENIARVNLGVSTGEALEPLKQLELLGVISGGSAKRINELAKSTQNAGAVMAMVRKEVMRFKGGMEEGAKTGTGAFSTFLSVATLQITEFGDAVAGIAKESIIDATKAMEEFGRSDTFKNWAEGTAKALATVKSLLEDLFKGGSARTQAFADVKSILAEAAEGAVKIFMRGMIAAGALFVEGVKQAYKMGGPSIDDRMQAQKNVLDGLGAPAKGRARSRMADQNRKAIQEEARRIFEDRLMKELGVDLSGGARGVVDRRGGNFSFPASESAPESAPGGYRPGMIGSGLFGGMNSDLFAKMFPNGITPDALKGLKPAGSATTADGKSLSVGDLFARAYDAKAGRAPGTTKTKPLYVEVVAGTTGSNEAVAAKG